MITLKAKELYSILQLLLNLGQSLYQIKSIHKEIKYYIQPLYNYIEMGVFKQYGNDYTFYNRSNCNKHKIIIKIY